jgi:protein O-mannosyl-transferase
MIKKLLFLLPLMAIFALLPGLSGPLLLDDTIHIGPIIEWLQSRQHTYDIIFSNSSGPFGRPVSILSFIMNAVTTGADIWPMKLSNLLLHLCVGLCVSNLLFRLFRRDVRLLEHAKVISITVASLWLILPQHVSTVFYVIQRMTLLSTLFAISACWLYVAARERIEQKQKNGKLLLLGVPFLICLSVLSKESGLLVPFYILLIECTYFQASFEKPRPTIISWSFRLGLVLPFLAVSAYLAFKPDIILGGYIDRDFSLAERAFTQISVLADYFASTFIPMMRSAGVFNDDFPLADSIGAKEVLLLLAGASMIFAAIRMRKKSPSLSFGIGLFFIGHLLESTIFPLEIYFAHRNYLPSIGLVVAAFSMVAGLLNYRITNNAAEPRILPVCFIGLFLAYAVVTYSRATLWSNNNSLMAHAQIHHPKSSRMRSEILLNALYAKRIDIALQQADIAMQTSPINEKRGIQLWRILAYCYAQAPQPKSELEALYKMPADRITLATSTALEYVSAAAEVNACPGLDRARLGNLAGQWATTTVQPPYSPKVWKTHHAAARLLASSGDLEAGYRHAQWAFIDSAYNYDSGLLAYQIANSLEDRKRSNEIMALMQANSYKYSALQKTQITSLSGIE